MDTTEPTETLLRHAPEIMHIDSGVRAWPKIFEVTDFTQWPDWANAVFVVWDGSEDPKRQFSDEFVVFLQEEDDVYPWMEEEQQKRLLQTPVTIIQGIIYFRKMNYGTFLSYDSTEAGRIALQKVAEAQRLAETSVDAITPTE